MRGRHRLFWSTSLVTLVAAGALLSAPGALAATITVPNGATVGQQVLNDGDTLLVEQGGTIDDAGSAVDDATNGSNLTIVNHGEIVSDNRAIETLSILHFANTGIISGMSTAIEADSFSHFTNSGEIRSAGGYGVNVVTLDNIENSGTIEANVFVALQGIFVGSVMNSGTIKGNMGVQSLTAIGSVTNTGIVEAGAVGIFAAAGDIGLVVNSGSIEGQTAAIVANGGELVELANTGTIIGGQVGVYGGAGIGKVSNEGGTISGDDAAIQAMGNLDSLTNSGTLTSSAGSAVLADAIGSVSNSGVIDGFSYGVFASNGDLGSLINSGTIKGDIAIRVDNGKIGTLINSGEISGRIGIGADEIEFLANSGNIAGDQVGIIVFGPATVVNSGLIFGGTGESGLTATTLNLTNSGTILGPANYAVIGHDIQSLTNSGLISGDDGIDAQGILRLTNSGTIRASSPAGIAIDESVALGEDTLLTLNAGSIIIGRVEISTGNDTLNVGDGLNLALTFDTSVPELIETNGNPFVVIGNTVHVVDAAALRAATELTAGLAGGIGGAVSTGLRQGFDELGDSGETNIWLEGFGAAGQGGAGRHLLGGIAAGADVGPDADHRVGAFAGAARGIMSATASSAVLDSLYAGVYGSARLEGFAVEGIFAAGVIETDHSRMVANNTVVTGLETATGTETAWFLAPQATLRKSFVTADTMWDASLTVGYTGVFGGGYTEAGVAAPLSVDPGTSHVLDAKALLRLPYANAQAGSGVLTADVHAGVTGTAVIAGAAGGTLGGTALALTAGDRLTAGLTAGGAFDYEFSPGATLYGGVDGRVGHDLSFAATAEAGLKGTF